MGLSKSLSSIIKLSCLALFLTTSLIAQAQAGSGKGYGWGKGGKNKNTAPTISSQTSSTVPTGSASLGWVAPTTRSDGTPLSLSELAGYTLYYGTSQGSYTDSIGIDDTYATSLTVTDLPVGTYYFVMTVRDTNGLESDYSGVASKQIQ